MEKLSHSAFSKLLRYFNDFILIWSQRKEYFLFKFLPTSVMLMLSAYIYTLLRGVKDSVLVPVLGAELISVIKFCGVFPSTVIFFICFTKLANILSRDKLYYAITIFFVSFFLLYAFLLYPFQDFFHPDLSYLIDKFPSLKYQILIFQSWTITLFYVMSELCGTVMLTLLFWQFANDIYTVEEAKKTYASFGLIGQFGLIMAGVIQENISKLFVDEVSGQGDWQSTLNWMMISIAIAGLGLILLYRFVYKKVIPNPKLYTKDTASIKESVKLSLKESFKYVFSSPYLWFLMLIVFSYGLGVNLIECIWKDQLRQQYVTHNSYSEFVGKFHRYFGLTTIPIMFIGMYMLRNYKWIVSALVTPIAAGLTGCAFFTIIIFKDVFQPILSDFGTTVMMMSVITGSIQVIIFKSCNYTFVDSTKEMAFIPLDRELRVKGKAAVDVIGGRAGKSFGAVLQQLMFYFITPNLADLTKPIYAIFVMISFIWIYSVISLNKRFTQLTSNKT